MSERYELIFTKEFFRKLKRLDRQVQIRILKGVKILEASPYTGKRLEGRLIGFLSLRQGDYRIIYQISKKKVIIVTVGHRKAIYE